MKTTLLATLLDPHHLSVRFQPIFHVHGESKQLHCLEALIRGPRRTNFERADVLFDYVRRKRAEALVDQSCVVAICDAFIFAARNPGQRQRACRDTGAQTRICRVLPQSGKETRSGARSLYHRNKWSTLLGAIFRACWTASRHCEIWVFTLPSMMSAWVNPTLAWS